MADILCFFRNRCNTVEQVDEFTIRSSCHLQDPLTEAHVQILVKTPDLEIISAAGNIIRSVQEAEFDVDESLRNVSGVRIGPGLKKIIAGIMGNTELHRLLTNMLEECCSSVILSFTKDVLLHAPKDKLGEKDYFENIVRSNPRLYNSCAAFAPGSPLVEGIKRSDGV
ncbi:MAG: hypothetical protein WBG50_19635 [Desulfomonilaceae bacterium]